MQKLIKTIDSLGAKGSYEVDSAGAVNIKIHEPFAIHDFVNPEVDFEIDTYLSELFNLVDTIKTHRAAFEKLHNGYSDFKNLLSIQYHKRVFHSETERDAYITDMCSKLREEFFRLYRKLIIPEVRLSYDFVLPVPNLIKQILKII